MISEDTKYINDILQSIYASPEKNSLKLSKFINEKLSILIEKLSNTDKPYIFDISKLLKFLNQYIQNLSSEIKEHQNSIEQLITDYDHSLNEILKNIKNKVVILENNFEKEKSNLNGKIVTLETEIDSLKEENNASQQEISLLKIKNDNLEMKVDSLNKKIKEKGKFEIKNEKEKEEQKRAIDKLLEQYNEMNTKIETLENELIGIHNRDNYKSIIYILLIYTGVNFEDIGGSIYNLIFFPLKERDKDIQKTLQIAYSFYNRHKALTHEGYDNNIMKKLFPQSKIGDKINDDLINKTKRLLIRYENEKFSNELSKNGIEKDISDLTSEIQKLNLDK